MDPGQKPPWHSNHSQVLAPVVAIGSCLGTMSPMSMAYEDRVKEPNLRPVPVVLAVLSFG